MRKREFLRLACAALAVPAIGSAASKAAAAKDLVPIVFQLNYPAAGFNAGFELAVQKGFYRDAGLDVKIEPGNGSQITAQLLAAGKVDLGFADSAAVMKLISAGAKMKVIATVLQGNPNQVTALKKTGLKSVADMKGKSVAVPNGGSQSPMLPLVLAANGLKETDVQLVNMPPDSMIPSLMAGQVQVILGSIDYFAINLKNLGVETDNFPFIDNGAPTVSTSIVGTDSFLGGAPGHRQGVRRGKPEGLVRCDRRRCAAVTAMKTMFPDAAEKLAPAQLDATKYLMCANRAKFVGKATPAQWEDTVKIFTQIDILPPGTPATAYTLMTICRRSLSFGPAH